MTITNDYRWNPTSFSGSDTFLTGPKQAARALDITATGTPGISKTPKEGILGVFASNTERPVNNTPHAHIISARFILSLGI